MSERILMVCLGIALGIPLAFAARWIGIRWGLLDHPGAIKPHSRPIPYTGGAGIVVVIVIVGSIFGVPWLALVGAVGAWFVGFLDDFHGLRPAWKLAATAGPLAVGAIALNVQPVMALAAVLVGVMLVNAFNVIDGLDGLAAGVGLLALLPGVMLGQPLGDLGAAAVGGLVGFLVLNLHPARLFMGDEGSLLLGYVLWLIAVSALAVRPTGSSLAFAILIWTFPILNVVFVLTKRILERRPVLIGDRGHLYDVLQRRYGLRAAVGICWCVAAAGSTLAALQY